VGVHPLQHCLQREAKERQIRQGCLRNTGSLLPGIV
jgi:hypothetical protein